MCFRKVLRHLSAFFEVADDDVGDFVVIVVVHSPDWPRRHGGFPTVGKLVVFQVFDAGQGELATCDVVVE